MSFVINDNNVTRDTYGVRDARLGLIGAHIDDYESELSLPDALLDWAHGAHAAWQ